jgi:hypothetical protein
MIIKLINSLLKIELKIAKYHYYIYMYFFNNFKMASFSQDNGLTEKIVEKCNGNLGIANMIMESLKHRPELFQFIMSHENSDMKTFYQIYTLCDENVVNFEIKIKQFTLNSNVIKKFKEKGFEGLTFDEQIKLISAKDTNAQKKYPMINKLHVCSACENDKSYCKLCGFSMRPWS